MKVIHAVSSIDLSSGGPSYTVTRLCSNLQQKANRIEIFTLDSDQPLVVPGLKIKSFPIVGPRKLGASPALKASLRLAMQGCDILHSHGLWMMPNIYPGKITDMTGCKLLISVRGMLSAWALSRSSIKKQIMGFLGQNKTLRMADCIHATAESELSDIRSYGLRTPVALIPNGIDMPDENLLNHHPHGAEERIILYFGRIHPTKGVGRLIDAWNLISGDFPGWKVVICGPGEDVYIRSILSHVRNSNDRVEYIPPVYDSLEKTRLISSADLFVLPTHSENFGVVVAEALAHKIPVITTKGAPWEGLVANRCGWWIDNDVESLQDTLRLALQLAPEERRDMGERGRRWVKRAFSWNVIADDMYATYKWLLGKGERPGCIFLD